MMVFKLVIPGKKTAGLSDETLQTVILSDVVLGDETGGPVL